MKASDLFVKCLENEGVKYIFGVPGEENADFMMSLKDSNIEFVLTRHEQGAAFMAEVYGRLTGDCGVCLGTLGPGASNLVTGVADANMDRAPVICITGQADSKRQHKESHQAMDVVSMFKPITKWAHSILNPNNIPEVVRKAFKLATTEKPGACHIELAEDIAKLDASTQPLTPMPMRRAVPDDKVVDRAYQLIQQAEKPIIIAGNGTIRRRASKQLTEFTRRTGIGVISTFMAKGCIDMDNEQYMYTIGLQARDYMTCALEASDVVICIGYDMVEYHPRLWNPHGQHRIIHIDFLPAEVDQNYRVDVEIVGDLAHTLWMLNQRIDQDASFKPPNNLQLQAARRQMSEDIAEHKEDVTTGAIRPQKILWDVRAVMGPDDIVLSDVGAHKMWIARYYHCHAPNTCLIPNGFCSMGFALPGGIAAGLVYPDRRVLAICGDGGFLMNVQEMETARRLDSNLTVMIWEDKAYGLIEWKQDNEFGEHTNLSFDNPDFVKLAESFGWRGYAISDSTQVRGALEASFQEPGPALIVLPIDYRENALLTERLGNIACAI